MHQEFLSNKTKFRTMKTRKNKREKAFVFLITLLTLFFIGTAIVNFTKNKMENWLVQLAELDTGEFYHTISLTGIVIKEETLVFAPASGKLEVIVPEGHRVGAGGQLAKIVGGFDAQFEIRIEQTISAPVAGIVSYEIDGLEQILNINNYKDLDLSKLPEGKKVQALLLERIEKGQPIGKIINNLKPLGLLIYFESREAMDLVKESNLHIFKLGDASLDLVSASLIEAKTEADRGLMIFETKTFKEDLINLREVNLELVLEHYQGLVVNERAIIYEYKTPGLMTVDKSNNYKWKPVEIIGQIGTELVISGLNKGTVYISNPK